MKTPSKKLVNQLLSHIKNNNTTASKIRNRQSKNIYPLGIRNFYDFCRGKPVSESSILKIEKFFELLQSSDHKTCKKCNTKRILMYGYVYLEPDAEPHTSGVEEKTDTDIVESSVSAQYCPKCNNLSHIMEE